MPSSEPLSKPKIMQFVDAAMQEVQDDKTPPSKNKPILELIDRVVRQAERAQRLVHERLPVLPGLARRTLNLHELKALATLIGYQSNNTGFQPNLIKLAAESRFGVEDVSHLSASQFDDMVHYLVYFHENEAQP